MTLARGPFADRRFRLLFAGRTVSLAGSAIAPVAVAFAVLDVSRSPAALGIVLGARTLPTVVFTLLGGVWADRIPRHRLMVGADLLSGATQAATAVLLLTGSAELWHLVVLQFAGGTAAAFFQPALGGVVPQLVPEEHRRQANALLGLSASTSRIGGAALGGIVVAFLGAGYGLAFDAATFFASALFLAQVRLDGAVPGRRSLLGELGEGWREFRARRWVWTICAQFAVVNALGMASFLVLGPLVAKESLGGALSWGFIQMGLAAGLVGGGALALRLRVRRPLLTAPLAGVALVPVLVLLALGASPVLIVLAAAVVGVALSVFDAVYTTELQNAIPADLLSRVLAYELLASFLFIPVGSPAVGAAAAAIGVGRTLWIVAAVVLVVSLAPLLLRDVREAPAPAAEAAAG